jgi:hypothetical protein
MKPRKLTMSGPQDAKKELRDDASEILIVPRSYAATSSNTSSSLDALEALVLRCVRLERAGLVNPFGLDWSLSFPETA